MRSAVATGIVAKPAARDVRARAGLKVFARMTKDRVNLKKDSKWRSDIDIYPVRAGARIDERRARGPRARETLSPHARGARADVPSLVRAATPRAWRTPVR